MGGFGRAGGVTKLGRGRAAADKRFALTRPTEAFKEAKAFWKAGGGGGGATRGGGLRETWAAKLDVRLQFCRARGKPGITFTPMLKGENQLENYLQLPLPTEALERLHCASDKGVFVPIQPFDIKI